MIVEPGVYPDMTMAEYLSIAAVSSGVIRATVMETPFSGWFNSYLNATRPPDVAAESTDEAEDDEEPASEGMNAGTIIHSLLLENDWTKIQEIDPVNYPSQKKTIPKGYTNNSIRLARDIAIAQGKVPILTHKLRNIEACVRSAQKYIDSLRYGETPQAWRAFQPEWGRSEVTMVFDVDGVRCRMRPDRISNDYAVTVHVKTTKASAHPDIFSRGIMDREGYYISGGFYRLGTTILHRVNSETFFLVIETKPPYLCSLIGMDPAWHAYADSEVGRGMKLWQACVARNEWPGYPNCALYPELPPWKLARMEEIEIASGHPFEWDKLYGKEPKGGLAITPATGDIEIVPGMEVSGGGFPVGTKIGKVQKIKAADDPSDDVFKDMPL